MPAFYFGVSFISAASLILQVSFSRILSVTQGYHFAFLIVSTALLGIGAAGTYLVLHLRWGSLKPERLVVWGPLLFGSASVGAFLLLNRIPFDVLRLAWEVQQLGYLLLAYLVLGVPFFFSGLTIASAFLMKERSIGRIYFSDLLGASIGAVLPLMLLPIAGGPGTILSAAALGTVAGIFLWAETDHKKIWRSILILFLLASGLISGYFIFPDLYQLQFSPYRGLNVALRYPGSKLVETQWNAMSRVDVVHSPATRFAPGLSLAYPGSLPPQLGIVMDADQLYAITAYDGTKSGLEFFEYLPSAAPYMIGRPQRVFIANPGGGLDVLMSVYFEVNQADVIERNPLIPILISGLNAGFSNTLYKDPRVYVFVGHERSFLHSVQRSYDLVVIAPLQVLGAAAGSMGLAEDYSLTIEAFLEYYRSLSKNGWVAITRYLEPQPVYAVRLLATAIEALERMDIKSSENHFAVIRSWGTLTLLVKPGGLSTEEIRGLREFADSRRFDLDYYPGVQIGEVNRYNRFPEPIYYSIITQLLDPIQRQEVYRTYPFDIGPVWDDSPFFSYVLRLSGVRQVYSLVREKWLFFVEGGGLLPVMLVQASFIAAVFILLPVWFKARTVPIETEWSRRHVLAYFFCIALGFMSVEMAMMQRLMLYLIHPVYAMSAVLAFILLFAGVGSLSTAKWRLSGSRVQSHVILALSSLVFSIGILLPWVLQHFTGIDLLGRFGIVALVIAPLGFLMGMPFPLGMERLKQADQQTAVTWAWAMNGFTSVAGAILSVILAIQIGITGVFVMAAIVYAIAAWIARGRWVLSEISASEPRQSSGQKPPW